MSRIGNRVLKIETGVTVEISNDNVKVSGQLGTINIPYNKNLLTIKNEDNQIVIKRSNEEKFTKMIHGTTNANIKNAIEGVSKGHKKVLKIVGVGYKAAVKGSQLDLFVGHSHNILIDIPQGLTVACPTPTEIQISGADKSVVGEFAAVVRSKRPPEPYKGKGVMYIDEHISRKVGKTADGKK